MKRRLINIFAVILSAYVVMSCNQELIQDNAYGYLDVCIENDISESVTVKSADEPVFKLDVLDMSGKVVKSVEDHRTVTSENPVQLSRGEYVLEAQSGEDVNAAFENPYYKGRSDSFTITPGKTTSVNLECSLLNTVVTVEFPDDFSSFAEYEVAVTNGAGDNLVFSNKPQSGNELEAGFDAKAYFAVTGRIILNVHLKNQSGYTYDDTRIYTGVKANQHYHFKFSKSEAEEGAGGFVLKVELDRSWEDTTHEITLDFNKENMPEVVTDESFPAVSGEPVLVGYGSDPEEEKAISFNAEEGLSELWMSHDISLLSDMGLSSTLDLMGESQDVMTQLRNAGVVVTESQLTKSSEPVSVSVEMAGLISSLEVGTYEIGFTLIDSKGRYEVFELIITVMSDADAQAVNVRTGWASFARFEGCFFELSKKDEVTFQYRKVSDSEWTELDPSKKTVDMTVAPMTYSMMVYGLEPSTEYVFRAVSSEDKDTEPITFTTAAAEDIHNLSFDNWYLDGKAWMPNVNASNYVWDSANPGTAGLNVVPTTPEESDVVKGKAARLETGAAMGMLAAGNIYIGQFAKVAGLGAELDWGYPFTSRPIALKGYYKYAPKSINKVKDPYKGLEGTPDQGQIQMLLTDWSERFHINTSKKVFVDFENDANIIAHGNLIVDDTGDKYVEFTIPLVYRNNRIPKYVVIVAAASRYGDYFTGATGSVMKVDEFELVYDPAELSDEEFDIVFSKINPF